MAQWFRSAFRGAQSRTRRLGIAAFAVVVAASTANLSSKPQINGRDLDLVQVQVITRHGARTPLASSKLPQSIRDLPWQCDDIYEDKTNDLLIRREGKEAKLENYDDYKKHSLHSFGKEKLFGGSCVDGQLTIRGQEQMRSFGELLRQRYVEDLKYLPVREIFDSDSFNLHDFVIRSTNTSRTVLTARFVMDGLYPPEKRPNKDSLIVHIREAAKENMYPRSGCPRLSEVKADIKNRTDDKLRSRQRQALFENISDDSERLFWTTRSSMSATNVLDSFAQHGFLDKLPKGLGIASNALEQATTLSGRYYHTVYSNEVAARLGIGRFIGELVETAQSATQSGSFWFRSPPPKPKVYLFSGHDNTTGPLLHAFRVSDGHHPPMGSAIILEVYRDPSTSSKYFQMLFIQHGKIQLLKMPECDNGLCDLDKFITRAKMLVPSDYESECGPKTESMAGSSENE